MTGNGSTGMSRAASGLLVTTTPWLLAAAVLIALPFIFSSSSTIFIMNQMAITIVFALAYNMLLGQGGMLSFGHAVYMGLGGFFCMHVINWVEAGLWLPLPFLPLLGGLFGMIFGIMIGSFSTRKAGTVFAMISLGVGELVASSSIIIVTFFGGEEGVSGDRTLGPPFFGIEWLRQIEVYYLITFWMLISAIAMYAFSRTPVGRMANAVRDNPERADFVGYSARKVRFYSFVASGFFAGVAGALFAINYEILTERNLNLVASGEILLITFLGGVGFFIGPIVGAVVFTLLQTVLSLETELWQLYVGALFVVTVMFFPNGLTGLIAVHAAPWRLGRLGELAVPYVKTLLPGLIGAFGTVSFIEVVHHRREAAPGASEMSIFWTTFDSHSILAVAIPLVMAIGGFWLAHRTSPALKAAWDRATTPYDEKPAATLDETPARAAR